jgi:hypothetical protein
VEIVEYLVAECQADVEQRGQYEVQDDRWVLTVDSASSLEILTRGGPWKSRSPGRQVGSYRPFSKLSRDLNKRWGP